MRAPAAPRPAAADARAAHRSAICQPVGTLRSLAYTRTMDVFAPANPLHAYPRPPFPRQKQPGGEPGDTAPMVPEPDHGEKTYIGHGRLAGRKALVTGADSGIGRAVAIAFAREGADVALSYLDVEQPEGDSTASWVEKAGQKAVQLPGDLSDEQTSIDVVDQAAEQL